MPGRRACIALAVAALAGAAAAQPDDPIDALLRGETLPPAAGPVPGPAAQRPAVGAPIYLHETGRSADGPPTSADVAYDSRIRASMAAAQGFLGPLDGGWSLSAGSRELYIFQLADRGGQVEGAWRDPRRPGSPGASGFIDAVEQSGADITFRFAGAAATLHPAADGRWSGELTQNGATVAVNLRRRSP